MVEADLVLLQLLEGIPVDEIRLCHQGRRLEDGHTLADYDMQNEDVVHLTVMGRCAPKQRCRSSLLKKHSSWSLRPVTTKLTD